MSKAWQAGLLLGLVAAAVPSRAEEWSRQYSLKGRPELHVTTDDGSVRIEAGDRPQIEARVDTIGWTIGAAGGTVSESQAGDPIGVEVRGAERRWSLGLAPRWSQGTLRVPRAAPLDAR